MVLYDYLDSGNGYKVRLLLAQLGLSYRYHEVDIMKGESRTPQFLTKSPDGRIPLLETAEGQFLAESDAILWYLAEGSAFIPEGRLARGQVLQWMFFEQYSHEPYVATRRDTSSATCPPTAPGAANCRSAWRAGAMRSK
jgi:glutathione S-transferase